MVIEGGRLSTFFIWSRILVVASMLSAFLFQTLIMSSLCLTLTTAPHTSCCPTSNCSPTMASTSSSQYRDVNPLVLRRNIHLPPLLF